MPARAFYLLFFVIALSVLPFLVFNLLISKTPLLPDAKSFVISSGSMEPVVPLGSIIYTVKQSEYRVGEVIAFLKDRGVVSHRIVGITVLGGEKYYQTKGDANKVIDEELIPKHNVYGRIVTLVPIVGNIILFYKNPLGLIFGTVLPTLLFLMGRISI